MKRKLLLLVLLVSMMFVGLTIAGEEEGLLHYARLAAQMELTGGALEIALDEGADTAMLGSIDALEYDLERTLSDEEKAKVSNVFREALARILTAEVWVETTAEVYARHLKTDDLRALTDFYQTDAGAKILAIQGPLNQDLTEAAESLVREGEAAFADQVDSALEEIFPDYGMGKLE